ncbi:MAG: peptidyl-tRNA hydrolase Pth2 [Candidatus Nanosalina sp.]
MSPLKQALVLREELEMTTGKMISQACHASLNAYKKASGSRQKNWESEGAKKVVLAAGDNLLEELFEQAKSRGLPAYLVQDAGLTEVEPGTKTALGIGPADETEIDNITGELELIR